MLLSASSIPYAPKEDPFRTMFLSTATDRSSIARTSGRRWYPEDVLKLCLDGRCVGLAPSKRRKCRMPIFPYNMQEFSTSLARLAEQQPNPELLQRTLQSLAKYGLCVQFHQYQANEMVEKWKGWINAAFPVDVNRMDGRRPAARMRSDRALTDYVDTTSEWTRQRPGSSDGVTFTVHNVAHPLDPVSVIAPSNPEPPTLRQTLDKILEALRDAERRLSDDSYQQAAVLSVPQSVSHVSTSSPPSLASSRPTSTASGLTARRVVAVVSPIAIHESVSSRTPLTGSTPSSRSLSSALSPANAPHNAPASAENARSTRRSVNPAVLAVETGTTQGTGQLSSAASPPNTQQVSPRSTPPASPTYTPRCTRSHARRLPFDDECPICYEGDVLSTCDRSELVWCRSGCGRTMHEACLEGWRKQCVIDKNDFACPVCRGDWDEGSNCDACDAVHVLRRPVAGECAICCDDLAGDKAEAGEGGLVWCKDSCGNSVHQECFDVWRTHCVAYSIHATCVSCRASWCDDCGC
jgi:hypothetical protein